MVKAWGNYACDAGSLKVGGKDFSILINNNVGDGCFCWYVCNEKDIPEKAEFVLAFQGVGLHIFDYDCSDGEPVEGAILTGSFFAYSHNGDIYLSSLSDKPDWWGENC